MTHPVDSKEQALEVRKLCSGQTKQTGIAVSYCTSGTLVARQSIGSNEEKSGTSVDNASSGG